MRLKCYSFQNRVLRKLQFATAVCLAKVKLLIFPLLSVSEAPCGHKRDVGGGAGQPTAILTRPMGKMMNCETTTMCWSVFLGGSMNAWIALQ